jgi:cytochrome c peroxidase
MRASALGAVALVACGAAAEDAETSVSALAPPITDAMVASAVGGRLGSLKSAAVPQPEGGTIVDQGAAIRLGKALFWDMQTGSDGQMACATCHHKAGAENRSVSQGVVARDFVSIGDGPVDECTQTGTERQLTARNAPSAIGAVFSRELFWDGRARQSFGSMKNAALASQSVGPPSSSVEMACAGRPFQGPNSLGSKLLARTALDLQMVDQTDSVLGALSASPAKGLRCGDHACSYKELISAAFGEKGAESAEKNFVRIWGEAIQAYESTLVPDDTPLDRYLAGDLAALTNDQKFGLWVFAKPGNCVACHTGAELTDATASFAKANGLVNEDGGDQGFHNVGVSLIAQDSGREKLSVSKANADRGAFKTPSLRNAKLTAPYFHDGSKPSLRDVVVFYSDWSEHAENLAKSAKQVSSLVGHNPVYTDALVEFLTNGLTDCRVENERAPFDHPSLEVPNGPSIPAVGAAGHGACP